MQRRPVCCSVCASYCTQSDASYRTQSDVRVPQNSCLFGAMKSSCCAELASGMHCATAACLTLYFTRLLLTSLASLVGHLCVAFAPYQAVSSVLLDFETSSRSSGVTSASYISGW